MSGFSVTQRDVSNLIQYAIAGPLNFTGNDGLQPKYELDTRTLTAVNRMFSTAGSGALQGGCVAANLASQGLFVADFGLDFAREQFSQGFQEAQRECRCAFRDD